MLQAVQAGMTGSLMAGAPRIMVGAFMSRSAPPSSWSACADHDEGDNRKTGRPTTPLLSPGRNKVPPPPAPYPGILAKRFISPPSDTQGWALSQ